MQLTDETIRDLIHSNQVAITQMGIDIQNLGCRIEEKFMEIEKANASMFRDIKDRWTMIKSITDKLEEISKQGKDDKKHN